MCHVQFVDDLSKQDVKIIILTAYEPSARAVLCEAYRRVSKRYCFHRIYIVEYVFLCQHGDLLKVHSGHCKLDIQVCL